MDLLIWSVEAKSTSEERSELATVVPDLFKRLAAGLKIAGVDDAIRESFFAELKDLHTEAIAVGEERDVAAAHDANAENPSVDPDAALPTIEYVMPDTIEYVLPATIVDVAPPIKPDIAPATNLDAAADPMPATHKTRCCARHKIGRRAIYKIR